MVKRRHGAMTRSVEHLVLGSHDHHADVWVVQLAQVLHDERVASWIIGLLRLVSHDCDLAG